MKREAARAQVLGRNLEGLVSRAQEQRTQWKDSHVSVEHLVLAFLDDARFGAGLLKAAGLTQDSLTKAIKEIRGSNRVTDQARPCQAPGIWWLRGSFGTGLLETLGRGSARCAGSPERQRLAGKARG